MLRSLRCDADPHDYARLQLRAYDDKPERYLGCRVARHSARPGTGACSCRGFHLNPSDQMFIRSLYGFRKPLPAIPGFESSGTVVEAGSGLMARFLKGRCVVCTASPGHRLAAFGRNTLGPLRNSARL
jgi:NADPH2:quinone reductase